VEEKLDRAVIVGGGIAGLTAGILLASHGVKVVLVEQHFALGGYLQGFSRKGLHFETGLHYVGACLPGQAFARYLTLLGVYDDLTFLTAPHNTVGRVILPNGRCVAAPQGLDAFAELAKSEFPKEREGIEALLREVRQCLQVTSWLDLREKVADISAYYTYSTLSADAVIRSHVSDPELIAFLSAFCFGTAMLPTECPFTLYTVMTHTLLSSCCGIQGGGRAFVAILRKRLESLGGRVILGNGARSIVQDGKRLSALVLEDGTTLDLDVLISTCHPSETVRFVGRERFSSSFLDNLDSLEMSNGSFKLYLELEAPVAALGADRWILCDSEWPGGLYLAAPSALDTSYGNRHCLDILAWQNFSAVERWQESRRGRRPADYETFKQETANRLLARVARDFPEIPAAIKHRYTSTPLTNLDYIRSARGAAMGIRQDITQQGKRHIRPRNKTRNLFLAGQSVSFPGILGAVVGATEVCDGLLGAEVDLFRKLQECPFRPRQTP
jgi:all-trans-retinol 13,14-reductase